MPVHPGAPRPSAPRRLAAVAAWAALLASAGDLLLLAVANAQRPGLALPPVPAWLLGPGALLGVAGIPCYALGWRAASQRLGPGRPLGARVVEGAGSASALVGAAIHGLTALEIRRSLSAAEPAPAPLEAMTAPGSLLLALWLLAAALVLAASGAFALAAHRGPAGDARRLVPWTPAFGTVVLVLLALPSELLRSFLAPAAPNLAHFLFFAACARRR